MGLRLLGGVIPADVMDPLGEVDVLLVKYGRPLERGSVETLTGRAVAVLGGERSITAQLVLDAAAVAFSPPLHVEAFFGLVVNAVGGLVFPLILSTVCRRRSLVLMRLRSGLATLGWVVLRILGR